MVTYGWIRMFTRRFAIEYDKNAYKCVWDNEEDELICGNEKLVDKLNELDIANKEYKILLDEYRKTVKHQSSLLADATKQGYYPKID